MIEQERRESLLNQSVYQQKVMDRNGRGKWWGRFFSVANVIAIIALIAIFLNVVNQAFGLVVYEYTVDPVELSERPLSELNEAELVAVLGENAPNRIRVVIRNTLSVVPNDVFTQVPISESLAGRIYPPERGDVTINDLTVEEQLRILSDNLTQEQLYTAINEQIIQPRIVAGWSLTDSLFNREQVEAQAAAAHPEGRLEFYSWLNPGFVSRPIASDPTTAGLRTALLGSMWILLFTILFAFPVGVGAAIYLQEYATDNWINRIIEINIRNLAGVPSIVYGLLGLAVFVRAFSGFTSGAVFGIVDSNGRTVISASLTLGLLILPTLIANAQEALRAVPNSIREGSYGCGATKWQTVRRAVLPAALPGIMTGMILSMARAIGETAPLIVVGASTFIGIDPNGPFSKFTVIPIQIYQWTSRPEIEFKSTAAAAIIVLLVLMLTLNGAAIILRQRFSRRLY